MQPTWIILRSDPNTVFFESGVHNPPMTGMNSSHPKKKRLIQAARDDFSLSCLATGISAQGNNNNRIHCKSPKSSKAFKRFNCICKSYIKSFEFGWFLHTNSRSCCHVWQSEVQWWQPSQVKAILRRGQHEEATAFITYFCFTEGHRYTVLNTWESKIWKLQCWRRMEVHGLSWSWSDSSSWFTSRYPISWEPQRVEGGTPFPKPGILEVTRPAKIFDRKLRLKRIHNTWSFKIRKKKQGSCTKSYCWPCLHQFSKKKTRCPLKKFPFILRSFLV